MVRVTKAMASKKIHTHSFAIDGSVVTISFEDKRTLNSLVNALEKAKSIVMEQPAATHLKVDTPEVFKDWTIVNKSDHVALKPPKYHSKEEVTLAPAFAIEWNPTFTGKYWNDGMYHFFPKKTKLSAEFTNEDMTRNLESMGALVVQE